MRLIIAGRGGVANAIAEAWSPGKEEIPVTHAFFGPKWPKAEIVPQSVAIHCSRSGDVLPELLQYCEARHIPLIQASTGMTLPAEVKVPVVDAPNLALPIVYLFGMVKEMDSRFRRLGLRRASVMESHQASKKSVPGTAVRFAEAVGSHQDTITSVRNVHIQASLGVPIEHIPRHGYHWITWTFADMEVEVRTRVHGLRPYALGALHIAERLLYNLSNLELKVYSITEVQ